MKTPIDTTIIDAVKTIVEGTKNDVVYSVDKEEVKSFFEYRTWFEKLFGFEFKRETIRRTTIHITVIERS